MESMIRDIKLAPSGHDKINWVKNFMPVMAAVDKEFSVSKPFAGKKMVITLHLEAKTAYMAEIFHHAGAEVAITGSNPLSTQDDVAAALVEDGLHVFAWHDCTPEEYDTFINKALDIKPDFVIDDGGDLVHMLHTKRRELLSGIVGGSEETTPGVHRLRALANEGKLEFPMIAANDAYCKYLFDNRYGTGQSTWDGIMRTTNVVIAGKNVVIALGTNGPIAGYEKYEVQTRALLEYLGPDRNIFWVNVYCPELSWQQTNNDYLANMVKDHPNVTIVDWYGLISQHTDWLGGDGIHPNDEGTAAYAKLIHDTMEKTLAAKQSAAADGKAS